MLVDGLTLVEGSTFENFTIASGTSFPDNPSLGEIFFRADSGKMFFYGGTAWLPIQTPADGIGISYPASAETGQLFYRTDLNALYVFNGTDWIVAASAATGGGGGGGGNIYDITSYFAGKPSTSLVMLAYDAIRAFTLPVGLVGSTFRALVAAANTSVLVLKKNNVNIGTLTFSSGGTVPAVSFTSSISFAIGDLLTITAPSSVDANLANITINLKADLVV